MIKKLLFGCVFLFLIINFVSAERYEDNYFKYGLIESDGDLQTTLTKINDVNVFGVICSSQNCDSISGYLYNREILSSSEDYIQLTYPTKLASSFGYGIYMFKEGYIPYELNADYWGTNPDDPQGPYDNYLTRKEICKAEITEMNADENSGIISADAKVYASITNAGPLNYIPDEIKHYYSTDVKVIFEIRKEEDLVYSEEKTVNIEFSGNKIVNFSSPKLDAGTYDISIISVSNDAKCLSSLNKQASKIITIEQQPIICEYDSDCGTNGFIENAFCSSNDIFQNFITFKCNNPGTVDSHCSDSTSPQFKQDCGENSCDNFEENYCKEGSVYHSRNCVNRGCELSSCFSNNWVDEQLVETCADGCLDGGCIILECHVDSDCGSESFSENYCKNDDVVREHLIPKCLDNACAIETEIDTVEECNYGCENAECIVPPEINCNNDSECGIDHWLNQFFCEEENVFDKFLKNVCINPGTSESHCDIILNPSLKQECDYGCEDGACISAQECSQDTDCASDFYSDKYCASGDVYKDYHDFSCVSEECKEEITKKLIKECDNGCKNGECKSNDSNGNSWCIETNNCELTFDDEAYFDDSITLRSTDINQNSDSILIGSNVSEKEQVSYFWILMIIIAIIVVLLVIIFIILI